ncbi:MAG: NFACT family protein [Marvinbryantia sp.]|uniref:Rqc2 family fibronectin-binding protein n=1 Tax=Marvinbryantia sp. TaxID=2496532 RepID=UPI0025DF91ED|nr:NFACT RNA binding domain-containing protein [uncultured Marvinbryantia sp.]
MALDGIVISAMVQELKSCILGGRISKIAQPEPDELMLTIKNERKNYRLLISAGASLPLIYFTETNKPGPLTAPNFCMLLRKHISGGKILDVRQPGLERIIHFDIEHLNELGDVCQKTLTVEIMGKHSNIIFCSPDGTIIDSIKHISSQVSSVREVLPGRRYFIPDTQSKLDPFSVTLDAFTQAVSGKPMPLAKAIYTTFTGISPLIAEELCHRASLESARSANSFSENELLHLFRQFELLIDSVKEHEFTPCIFTRGSEPVEFSVLPLTMYSDLPGTPCESVSEMLETYYAAKNTITRIRQKSVDLRKIVQTSLDRERKKYDLQQKQLKDTEKRDKYRVYGELINTYGYGLEPGVKKFTALNYYTNEEVTIPLDETLTPQENAKKYFDKYSKQKRTYEHLSGLIHETEDEISHLESISTALDIALSEEDLVQIKEELVQYGYIRRHAGAKRVKITSKPFHYISSDGFHIYVGKNNYQNEELTFKFATGNDWWFHAKGAPGSHVIVKANNEMPPDSTFEEAARLAAYYSKNRAAEKVEIDYVEKKHVKKVNGAKPGFVIYHTNYSMVIDSDIRGIKEVKA